MVFCFDCQSETVERIEKQPDGTEIWKCRECGRTWPVKLGESEVEGKLSSIKGIDPLANQPSTSPPKIHRSTVEDTVVPEAMIDG